MEDEARIARLASVAKTLTYLPLSDQYRALFAQGLTLQDINWENCVTHPGMETSLATQPVEPKPPGEPTP